MLRWGFAGHEGHVFELYPLHAASFSYSHVSLALRKSSARVTHFGGLARIRDVRCVSSKLHSLLRNHLPRTFRNDRRLIVSGKLGFGRAADLGAGHALGDERSDRVALDLISVSRRCHHLTIFSVSLFNYYRAAFKIKFKVNDYIYYILSLI